MKPSCLSLRIKPADPGDFLITSPVQVEFLRTPGGAEWQPYQSTLDYHHLIRYLNHLQIISEQEPSIFAEFKYGDVYLWQFISPLINAALLRVLEIIDTLLDLIQKSSPAQIALSPCLDNSAHLWTETVKSVAAAAGIELHVEKYFSSWHRNTVFVDYPPLTPDAHSIWQPFLRLSRLFSHTPQLRLANRKAILVSQHRHWVPIPGNPSKKYDEQMYPLLPALSKRHWDTFIAIDCGEMSTWDHFQGWRQRKKELANNIRWHSFFEYATLKKTAMKAIQSELLKLWREKVHAPAFKAIFQYRGISLFPALQQDLWRVFSRELPNVVRLLETAEGLLRQEKPQCIIVTSEAIGTIEKAIVLKAKRLNIPTLGLQHGMIFDNHYHYMHRKIVTDGATTPLGFVRPQVTCVWGPAWKRNLTEAGYYSSKAVQVTGNWRYDHLADLKQNPNIEQTKRRLNIPSMDKVILIVSGNQKAGRFLRQCMAAIEPLNGVFPLIKIHPLDDHTSIHQAIKHFELPKSILLPEIFEGLFVADLVISQLSTVVGEALFLEKRVLLVNFDRLQGWDVYTESDAVFSVTDPTDLEHSIRYCLDLDELPDEMQTAREIFIQEYYLKMDGKSALRVAEMVEKLAPH